MITSPSRQIRLRYNGVSGDYPSLKNGRMMAFESLLERDFMLLLEFDQRVIAFCEQPVTIPYSIPSELSKNKKTKASHYTPDLIVYYREDEGRPPELCEIKPERELLKYAEDFAPKFSAAEAYARNEGYFFRVISSADFSPKRISNANDLYQDLNSSYEVDFKFHLEYLVRVTCEGQATGRQILEQFGHHENFIAKFRLLIALGWLTTNWDETISLDSVFEWGQSKLAWERGL